MAWLLLAALFVPSSSFAAEYFTINEVYEQAAVGWHKTYTAHGREISVDVDAKVPDVEAVPIVKCKYAEDPQNVTEGTDLTVVYREPELFGISGTSLGQGLPVPEAERESWHPTTIMTYYPPIPLDMTFSGYPLALDDLLGTVRDMLAQISVDPNSFLLNEPNELMVNEYYDAAKGEEVVPAFVYADFYQLMRGIPILMHWNDAYKNGPLHGTETRLSMIISPNYPDANFYVGLHAKTETTTLDKDVPLCSFSKVIDSLEKEIEAGHIREIYDLRFGYALCSAVENGGVKNYIEPNDQFYAVPVWTANCMFVPNAKKEMRVYDESYGTDERNAMEYQKIMVNAQTGELIDPMSMGKNPGY
jgi:hypothetical protein